MRRYRDLLRASEGFCSTLFTGAGGVVISTSVVPPRMLRYRDNFWGTACAVALFSLMLEFCHLTFAPGRPRRVSFVICVEFYRNKVSVALTPAISRSDRAVLRLCDSATQPQPLDRVRYTGKHANVGKGCGRLNRIPPSPHDQTGLFSIDHSRLGGQKSDPHRSSIGPA